MRCCLFLLNLLTLTLAAATAQAQTYTVLRTFNETDGCCALSLSPPQLRWNCVTSTDPNLLQSPFRSDPSSQRQCSC